MSRDELLKILAGASFLLRSPLQLATASFHACIQLRLMPLGAMMDYEGLRDWLSIIEQRGELTTLEDVDWNLEMGAVVDVLYREHPPYPPALIFDRIKEHKPGYRALFGHFASHRIMAEERDAAAIYIGPGKHGSIHKQKYFEKHQPMPVNVVLGGDPLDWFAASCPVPAGVSEFDFAGGLRGAPTKVIRSDITGLPYPADAEIVLEGEIRPGELREEGPFGEWPGYYASPRSLEPFIRVQRVLHRHHPILSCANPARPPHTLTLLRAIARSAHVWEELEQAGMVASQCFSGGYQNRFTIVVDDDIDPTRIDDVVWALSTRCDPESGIDIQRRCWSSSLDPMIHPDSKL